MADSSKPPRTHPADEERNPGEGTSMPLDHSLQKTEEGEVRKDKAALVASELTREELVQSAISFLKHPKVATASDVQRRSFLEKKGLTVAEIDEAFMRLLSPSSNAASSTTFTHQGAFDHSCRIPQETENGENNKDNSGSLKPETESVEPLMPRHPKSYMEIMAMIQRGEQPDDIQEINDKPPNPGQPLSKSRMAPRPKPWEKQGQESSWDLKPLSSDSTELRSQVQDDNSSRAEDSTNNSNQGDLVSQAEAVVVSDTPTADSAT